MRKSRDLSCPRLTNVKARRSAIALRNSSIRSSANAGLPDYARIHHWVRGLAPFTVDAGLATANGRALRPQIEALHRDALASSAVPTP